MSESQAFILSESRIEALRRFDILDTQTESSFYELAQIAALVAQTPYSAICFFDTDRIWVKASMGAELETLPLNIGACSELISKSSTPSAIAVHKIKAKPGANPLITELPDAKVWIAAPILCPGQEHLLGAVCVFDNEDSQLSPIQSEALMSIGRQITRLLELRQSTANLELANVKMQVLIDRDALTGLPNDRVFRSHLRTEFQYARRHGQPLSIVMVKLNTNPESAQSTEVLEDQIKKLARLLGRDTREYDLIARCSESQFAIVMRNATYEIGTRVSNRLQTRIDSSDIDRKYLSLDFAVASLSPEMVSSRDLINKAEENLPKPRALSAA
jgi:diguanylate cyclase (GGDEF)-like protein